MAPSCANFEGRNSQVREAAGMGSQFCERCVQRSMGQGEGKEKQASLERVEADG